MIARIRTAIVVLFVGVLTLRWSLSQPVSAVTARIAAEPWDAVRSAGDVWTFAGTLGGGTVGGIRELPYAFLVALGTDAGLSAHTVEATWRVVVAVVAVLGAVYLARGLSPDPGTKGTTRESWAPWAGALFFAVGTVLVPTVVRSPGDGLAAACLPWVVAPLLVRGRGWRPSVLSAAWVGLAGVGSIGWALAVLVAGLVAALPRRRADVVGALRWMVLAAAASAWWLVLAAWELRHSADVSAFTSGTVRGEVAAALGRPDLAVLALVTVVGGPIVVALGALLLRSPRLDRVFVAALLSVVAAAALLAWFGARPLPVPAPAVGELPTGAAAPLLGLLGLAGLVAWCPLAADLGHRLTWVRDRRAPRRAAEVAGGVVAVLVGITAFAGVAATVAEPAPVAAEESQLLDLLADWSSTAAPGRALVLPAEVGSSDLPAIGTALGARPWIGRDAEPTSGAGGTTAIDDLISRLVRGDAGPGTSSALRRLGISYVLVRLGGSVDEDRERPTALVRSALDSIGADRVTVLRGPDPDEGSDNRLMDFGVRSLTPQIEVWAPPAVAGGWVYEGEPVAVVGDAGTVSDLAGAGVVRDRAIRLRPGSEEGALVVSDSARRRDVDQRVPLDPYGPDLGVDDPRSVLPTDGAPVTSAVARLEGALRVTASSSAADLDAAHRELGTAPAAAIDDNAFTAWQSRRGSGVGAWWQVEFREPTRVSGTEVQMVRNALSEIAVDEIQVSADDREVSYAVDDEGRVDLGDLGEVKRLRITVTSVAGAVGDDDSIGIVDVTVPGVEVRSPVVLDDTPAAGWLMTVRPASTTQCVPVVPRSDDEAAMATTCSAGLWVNGADISSLDRVVRTSRSTSVVGRAWMVAGNTQDAAALADRIAAPSVMASSTGSAAADLRARPQAAADADLTTAWRPAASDRQPTLTLAWTDLAEVRGLRLLPPTADVGSRPTRVRVTAEVTGRRTGIRGADVVREVDVDTDGAIDLPGIYTRTVTITVLDDTGVPSVNSATGAVQSMPVAVGEVEILGGPAVTYDGSRSQRVACDEGPVVTIDGVEHGIEMDVSPDQIVQGAQVLGTVCGRGRLVAGENRVLLPSTFLWQPRGLILVDAAVDLGAEGATAYSAAGPAPVSTDLLAAGDHADSSPLDLGAGDGTRTLVLPLPAGAGWQASVDGERLDPVTVDGWAQGWVVPAGSGEVDVRYSSGDELVRTALVASAGWAAVLLLLVGLGIGSTVSAIRRPPASR
ncbi:DUF3367 domain-containing protein [Nocardioides sp. MAH-18]|uniref:DUF3367 domain-containing protein n=1 Tax=Nocardioides agri TaxID=2682843 RepID=A0A6L6XWH1_9ACTN|nr:MULTISPECIES: alpha-(1->3)-arabinofuranosyltransferase family protein [unclassified Nocardioides]MBA2952379.1 DUF3367 domain-containing protein [Nocardioides sp. CGMCC 1.13656]MVQ51539.1 DUF3367 domain-containing protein [Nocardioides sp. MAH-18]